jgi:hypothetical protein
VDYHSFCPVGILAYTFNFRFRAITRTSTHSATYLIRSSWCCELSRCKIFRGVIQVICLVCPKRNNGTCRLMFSVVDKPVYLVYSVNSHNKTGTWMLIMCIILLVIVLPFYLIKRALFYSRIRQVSSPADY